MYPLPVASGGSAGEEHCCFTLVSLEPAGQEMPNTNQDTFSYDRNSGLLSSLVLTSMS